MENVTQTMSLLELKMEKLCHSFLYTHRLDFMWSTYGPTCDQKGCEDL